MIQLRYQTKAQFAFRAAQVRDVDNEQFALIMSTVDAGITTPIVSSEYLSIATQSGGSIHAAEKHVDASGNVHYISRVHAPGTTLNSTTLTASAALVVNDLASAEVRELLND